MENLLIIRDVLRNFELLSRLMVNLKKYCIWGLDIGQYMVEKMAGIMGCEIGNGLLSYLGMNVGINHNRFDSWNTLVEKIRKQIAKWKDKNSSLAGRVMLIQAVLSTVRFIICLSTNCQTKFGLRS